MYPYTFPFNFLKPPSRPPPTLVEACLAQSTPRIKLAKMAGNLAACFFYSGFSQR